MKWWHFVKGKITTEKDWKWFAVRGKERERTLILTYILFQFILIACHLETNGEIEKGLKGVLKDCQY